MRTQQTIKGVLRVILFYSDDEISSLSALCPACDFEHSFRVDLVGHGRYKQIWEFNGNYDAPTFRPSMGANIRGQDAYQPRCHSWVTDGQWHYLADCTHAMANQIVDMIPPDSNMGFERRHGWHLYPWCNDDGIPIKILQEITMTKGRELLEKLRATKEEVKVSSQQYKDTTTKEVNAERQFQAVSQEFNDIKEKLANARSDASSAMSNRDNAMERMIALTEALIMEEEKLLTPSEEGNFPEGHREL